MATESIRPSSYQMLTDHQTFPDTLIDGSEQDWTVSIKHIAKQASLTGFSAALSPFIGACKVHMAVSDDDPFERYAMALALIPGVMGREMRRAFYKSMLRRCGESLKVGFGSYFVSPDTEVGDHLTTGSYCVIGPCIIGDHVAMASHISVLDGVRQHGYGDMNKPIVQQVGESLVVQIGDHTWIGEGARVAASVGHKSIVGVGAVVTRPVKDGVMVLGNPARVIGHRDKPLKR
jgi:acetyltransferase-like isoleucine patch superfamily enzyme